jgi:broad specificity phosphatase PhoE
MSDSVPVFYLVRHATPDWTRSDLPYHLPPGPPLTAQGESEAVQLGAFLREAGVRRIYASPLERCWRTAQIVAGEDIPHQIEECLIEWGPNEKEAEVRARCWPFWEQLGNGSAEPGPVVLVTHGGPITLLLKELGLDRLVLDHYRKLFDRNNPLPPAGAWRVTRSAPDATWELSLAFVPEAYRKILVV